MGRGRTKGKKLTMSNQDDLGSGEEEKIPAQKRRGRPLKPLKNEIDEDNDAQKLEDEDSDDTTGVLDKEDARSNKSGAQNGKKRKKNGQVKDNNADPVKEEVENGTRSSTEELNKSNNGFRQSRSRRKNNTPRRAAESVVECN